MVDYGLLGALRGRTNWSDIKQEKQNELAYQSVLNRMQEEQNLAQQQKQAAINEYLQAAGKLNVLPRGMDRIREVNDPLVAGIAENIKKYNGDVDKYMAVQGEVDLHHYLNNLMNHPTTVKELMNASAASKYFADKQLGRQERGEVDPLTGNLLNPFEQRLASYNAGDTDVLNYSGSFDFPDFDTKVFGENYGNPNNPYQVVPVGVETLREYAYNEFKKKGLDDRDAKQAAVQYASQYGQALKNPKFQPYTFKHDRYPTKAGSSKLSFTEQAKLEDAKYTIEQLAAAMTGKDSVYRTVSGVKEGRDANGNITHENYTWKRGTPLTGTSIGKFSYPSQDASGRVIMNENNNLIKDWIFQDGKPYVKTTESELYAGKKVNGTKVDRFGYIPVTDDIISGIAKTNGIPFHALRNGLIELGAYDSKTPEVENAAVGGKSFTQEQEDVIAENLKANPDYTREEIIEALGY